MGMDRRTMVRPRRSRRRCSCWRRRAAARTRRPRRPVRRGGGGAAEHGRGELGRHRRGQLNIIAWAGYAEDGSNDKTVDWVTPFEKQTGCQVNVKIGNTSDEMVTLMKTGQYDGVSASGDATLRLIYAATWPR
jgi:spermidine/putrescine-binding protein